MINQALFAALLQSNEHTLVVAPMGYGKTLNLQTIARKLRWTYLDAESANFQEVLAHNRNECVIIDHAAGLSEQFIMKLLTQHKTKYILALYHTFYDGLPRLIQEGKVSVIDHHILSLGTEQLRKLGLAPGALNQSAGWPFLTVLMSESMLSVTNYLDSLSAQLSSDETLLLGKAAANIIYPEKLNSQEQKTLLNILNKGLPLLPSQGGLQMIPAFASAVKRRLSAQGYTLCVRTFGTLQSCINAQPLKAARIGKNPLLLLTYLLIHGPASRNEIDHALFNGKGYVTQAMSLLKKLLKPYFDEPTLDAMLSTRNQNYSLALPSDIRLKVDYLEFTAQFQQSNSAENLEHLLRNLSTFLPEYDCPFASDINLQLQDKVSELAPTLLHKAHSPEHARELLLLALRFTGFDPQLTELYQQVNLSFPPASQLPLPPEDSETYAWEIEELLERNNGFSPLNTHNSQMKNAY